MTADFLAVPVEDQLDLGLEGDGKIPSLSDRYLIPPFSILDARQGWWQQRKRQWLACGIQSELGRADGLAFSDSAQWQQRKGQRGEVTGSLAQQTSVFDPVLCELAYRWWCPPSGIVIDPFAGGSVRGLVAAMLGRAYYGCDMSAAQVQANHAQGWDFEQRSLIGAHQMPAWIEGDSAQWNLGPDTADFLFTCPPYLWLERYSDDADDLSTMSELQFGQALGFILTRMARALRNDRFAVIVAGDARDSSGRLADMRGITIRAAEVAGLRLHSTAVLITPAGSLPVRVRQQFEASRMLGATHQDVLVFCKGDRKRAAAACSPVT